MMTTEATLIDGKSLAAAIRADVATRVQHLRSRGVEVHLDAVIALGDEAATIYARKQATTCAALGIGYTLHELPADSGYEDIAGRILLLNADENVSAIMVHLPLPTNVNTERIQSLIDPDKDIEGVNPANIGRVVYGRRSLIPCTALAVMHMIESTGVKLQGARCVCVGASNIVGKPVAILLMGAEATLISTNKYTAHLADETKRADVLVSAAGVPGLITGDMVKPGAVVVDVGISRVRSDDGTMKTTGDIHFDSVKHIASHLSPVPGGVGPVTVAMLLQNTVEAAEK